MLVANHVGLYTDRVALESGTPLWTLEPGWRATVTVMPLKVRKGIPIYLDECMSQFGVSHHSGTLICMLTEGMRVGKSRVRADFAVSEHHIEPSADQGDNL